MNKFKTIVPVLASVLLAYPLLAVDVMSSEPIIINKIALLKPVRRNATVLSKSWEIGVLSVDTAKTAQKMGYMLAAQPNMRFDPAGKNLLFSSRKGSECQVMHWDGQKKAATTICKGLHPDWVNEQTFVYCRGQELVLRDLDDGSETVIHEGEGTLSFVDVSADGEMVLFVETVAERTQLQTLAIELEDVTTVAEGNFNSAPRWSHSGMHVAYENDGNIFVADPASGESKSVVSAGVCRGPIWSERDDALIFSHAGSNDGPWTTALLNLTTLQAETLGDGELRMALDLPPPSDEDHLPIPLPQTVTVTDHSPQQVQLSHRWLSIAAAKDEQAVSLWSGVSKNGRVAIRSLSENRSSQPIGDVAVASQGDEHTVTVTTPQSKVAYRLGTTNDHVAVHPSQDNTVLELTVPIHAYVVPDDFANDQLFVANQIGDNGLTLPADSCLLGLCPGGNNIFYLVGTSDRQSIRMHRSRIVVETAGQPFMMSIADSPEIWQKRPIINNMVKWKAPFSAHWRIIGGSTSTLFSDLDSIYHSWDGPEISYQHELSGSTAPIYNGQNVTFQSAAKDAYVFAWSPTTNTPQSVRTGMDFLQHSLGYEKAKRFLHENALLSCYGANQDTIWPGPRHTLRTFYQSYGKVRRLGVVQERGYVHSLGRDMKAFTAAATERIGAYREFFNAFAKHKDSQNVQRMGNAAKQAQALNVENPREEIDEYVNRIMGVFSADGREIGEEELGKLNKDAIKDNRRIPQLVEQLAGSLLQHRQAAQHCRYATSRAYISGELSLESYQTLHALTLSILSNRHLLEGDQRGRTLQFVRWEGK